MLRQINFTLAFACAVAGLGTPVFAFRSGPPAGANGSTASFGATCKACHGNAVGAGSVQILGAPNFYTPNTTYNISVRVSEPTKLGAGFQISVEDSAGNHRGTLILTDLSGTQHNGGWVNHTLAGVNNAVANWGANGNSATYNLQWQAPATDQGTLKFWAAGNAINNNFASTGDFIYLTNVSATFSPGTGACCNDSNGVCSEALDQTSCESGGGRFGGAGSTCGTISPPCVAPTGACCDDNTGLCDVGATQATCEGAGRRWGGANSTCGTISPACVPPVTGACCDGRGFCAENVVAANCTGSGVRFGGANSTCADFDPPCEAPVAISLKPYVTGLISPVDMANPADGSGRNFIVEQTGQIKVADANGNILGTFLDVSSKLVNINAFYDERGLLGLAFHPNYSTNGRFFIHYSAPRAGDPSEPCNDPGGFIVGCDTEVIAEYHVMGDPLTSNVADPGSEIVLFTADKPQFNHDGGQVAFGPDGYLYFTFGDGGGANDGLGDGDPPGSAPTHGPIGNAQNRFAKLGKVHRIDVDTPPQERWSLESTIGPSPRIRQGMVWDSCRNVAVLYGGRDDIDVFSDTWEWDGTKWKDRNPGTNPGPHEGHAMVFDSDRCVTVLFGGDDGTSPVNDTWEWNGTNWVQKCTSGCTPPSPRRVAGAAFDSVRNATVVFGGYDGSNLLDDAWEWDGNTWDILNTPTPPAARAGHTMSFDPVANVIVMFGGALSDSACGPLSDETWQLDLAFDPAVWTQIPTSSQPSPRSGSVMTYDSFNSRFLLFGGTDGCTSPMSDTWQFSGGNWIQLFPQVSPGARHTYGMAFDPIRKRALMFGGSQDPLNNSPYYGDTWSYGMPAYSLPPDNPFISGVDGLPEIYAYGLRNPYKFSFDQGPGSDGTFWLPDVGQDRFEEVNIGVNGGNYGWVIREAGHCFDPLNPTSPPGSCPTTGDLGEPLIAPVMEYAHPVPCTTDADCTALGLVCDPATGQCSNEGGISIIGGYMYRGSAVPMLSGKYTFGDFSSAFFTPDGRLYYMDISGPNAYQRRQFYLSPDNAPLGKFIKGMARDENNELYVLVSDVLGPSGTGGRILRIAPAFPTTPVADPTGIDKVKFVSFSVPPSLVDGSVDTALRIHLISLHHVIPPYTGTTTIAFTAFEGQHVWVGPPSSFVESTSSQVPFHSAATQCAPYYTDWSSWGLLHVRGSAVVPSSNYLVENVSGLCQGNEATPECSNGGARVSGTLPRRTTRWADVEIPYNPPSPTAQPDLADISAMVNKFRDAPGAPIKARVIIAPNDLFGTISDARLSIDFGFTDISQAVNAFRGLGYPAMMGKCATSNSPCTSSGDCGANGPCNLYCP